MGPTPEATPQDFRAALAESVGGELDSLFDPSAPQPAVRPDTVLRLPGSTPAPAAPVPPPPPVTPPVAAPAPAPPSPAPAPAPSPTPEPTPEGGPKKYAGKYTSIEEMEKGYHHLLNILTETQATLKAKEEAPGTPPAPAPRANPVERQASRRDEALGKFHEEYGVKPEDLAAVVDTLVEESLSQKITPMQEVAKAEAKFRTEFPDAANYTNEIAATINADPNVQRVVAMAWQGGDYLGAMRYAWAMHQIKSGLTAERGAVANAAVADQELQAARVQAGLVSSQNSGATDPVEPEMSPQIMQNLLDMYHAGNKAPLLRATIARDLPAELFDPRYM